MAGLNSTTSTGVHISSWDQNQVKVDAVKYADTKARLAEAKLKLTQETISFDSNKYPSTTRAGIGLAR